MISLRLLTLALFLSLVGYACAAELRKPDIYIPEAFTVQDPKEAGNAEAIGRWWRLFGDPTLESLVEAAIRENKDIKIAASRIREARASLGISQSTLYPFLDGGLTTERLSVSKRSPEGAIEQLTGSGRREDLFSVPFDARWEWDLFGRNHAEIAASQANLDARQASGNEVLVSVVAEVGVNYVQLRTLQRRLLIVKQNLAIQQDALRLAHERAQVGLGSRLDEIRAEAEVFETQSSIPEIEAQETSAIHRLEVLTARRPGTLEACLAKSSASMPSGSLIPLGLPSELLRRRPDVIRAEQQVTAALAHVKGAKADLYPSFYLTGLAGQESLEVKDLMNGGSRYWTLGAGLRRQGAVSERLGIL